MTFRDILNEIDASAFSLTDKGTRFEILVLNYFLSDPQFCREIDRISLWGDFPFRTQFGGGHDVGIDIVAQAADGGFWAIQCKFYGKGTTIGKQAVDSFISTSGKQFEADGARVGFARRYWVDTCGKLGGNAVAAIENQQPAVIRLGLADLEGANVDWEKIYNGKRGAEAQSQPKTLRPDQAEAKAKALQHFASHDRGKMIMACGTGKTFTSLKIAEELTNNRGTVLFLVPSIALLSQTLKAWKSDAQEPLSAVCVCSDAGVGKQRTTGDDGLLWMDQLSEPATTDAKTISRRLTQLQQPGARKGMLVVFSTYQSIDAVAEAQKSIGAEFGFDLIVCDEAHRTTGVTLDGEDESAFVKVHDDHFIRARKRLYMTATPRIYTPEAASKAEENNATLISMDDEALFGKEFYRISFGEAVERGILTDYKVLVMTLDVNQEDLLLEYPTDWTKIAGTISGLSKVTLNNGTTLKADDPNLMHRAIAFCPNITISKQYEANFNSAEEQYTSVKRRTSADELVAVQAQHVDGSMGATARNDAIQWLKDAPTEGNECRILTNVRCLSEGVDVPALDAAIFLSPRDSQVEIVQAVGRVMRKFEGKRFGYLIIPVIVNTTGTDADTDDTNDQADKILNRSAKDFQIVWKVVSALRSHDERLEILINNPDFLIQGGTAAGSSKGKNGRGGRDGNPVVIVPPTGVPPELFEQRFYARMVQKVGDRRYWVQWAKDIAAIVARHSEQIRHRIRTDQIARDEFDQFLAGLHTIINSSITADAAIDMLAQQMVTKPVFEALFDNAAFAASNPISKAMDRVLDVLDVHATSQEETDALEKFYTSVRRRAAAVQTAEGRQSIIVELYDSFFKNAFPRMVEQLGIVYTPVEVVDFIIQSVQDVLRQEFGRNLTDEGVNIIDPFTGTGTFMARLLQSPLIADADLLRKYSSELNANEIVLLAYYIAAINIENALHSRMEGNIFFQGSDAQQRYHNFDGICLTDTFQLYESTAKQEQLRKIGWDMDRGLGFSPMFPVNSRQLQRQQEQPIQIIIGNPPYSVGQKSANDNAQNLKYPALDKRVEETYAKGSKATSVKALYDSYIKAFRWATDRLDTERGGVIGFVTPNSWIDGNSQDGMRRVFEKEFSDIYILNLRGNGRTSGETCRKEGEPLFAAHGGKGGSLLGISVNILVKNPKKQGQKASIHYYDIGDYLTRADKLKLIKQFGSVLNLPSVAIPPNEHGDWINQRNNEFGTFVPIEPEKKFDKGAKSWFVSYSLGIASSRDSWVWNFSTLSLQKNLQKCIDFYNSESDRIKGTNNEVTFNSECISWNDSLITSCKKGVKISFNKERFVEGLYRPFCKNALYYEKQFIQRTYQQLTIFPTPKHENLVICVSGVGASKDFSCLITDCVPDLQINFNGQCFPLYYYEELEENPQLEMKLEGCAEGAAGDRYVRRDGVSDWILRQCRERYGAEVTKEDVFYFVYGFLHSPAYRAAFANDLKKMLPRIPLLESREEFWAFSHAGRRLAALHLNYENVPAFEGVRVVEKGGANAAATAITLPLFGAAGTETSYGIAAEAPAGYGAQATYSSEEYQRFAVQKMRFPTKDDKSTIVYNAHITIENIPPEAYHYVVNGKSAVEWVMERYQLKTDKDSGITNDPNLWSREHCQPRYILDLLLSVVNVSVQTAAIVATLPPLKFGEEG